ncbi:MAG: glycosyltransferase, partial [Bacteroidaceae bacterium]|nr:glycosyltransferase [Bacteroidaceae bacterium]
MIPKIIHYCWFGRNPLPESAKKCIASWRKNLPDYEIKEWNEDNFNVNIIPYTKEAYEVKKYAFVSDYARFWILYHHGGIYFDTDVEVIRPMEEIIRRGPFMGREAGAFVKNICNANAIGEESETALGVAPGLGLGVNPGLGLYKEFLDLYNGLNFTNTDGTLNTKTIVCYTTEILLKHGLDGNNNTPQEVAGVWI